MASQGQELRFKAGEVAGQAQAHKDQMVDKATDACQSASQSCQQSKEQAGGFLQQTGDQVKQMAQGAADTVKNTLGIGGNNNPTSRH